MKAISPPFLAYEITGLRVRSELDLPAAVPIHASPIESTDVTIRLRERIDPLANTTIANEWIEVGDRDLLFRPAKGLTFRIRNGCEISISKGPEIADSEVSLFLIGTAWGVLCHQRGLLPLHCSAVQFAAQAFAFTGPSGAGKSTLAAGLSQRGRRHICDDLCVVDVFGGGVALRPPQNGLKLCHDAAEALDIERGPPISSDPRLKKFYAPLPEDDCVAPLNVAALYVLTETGAPAPSISRLRGSTLFQELYGSIYRKEWLGLLRDSSDVFAQIAELSRRINVFQFARPKNMALFNEGLDLIEAHMDEIAVGGEANGHDRRA